MLQVHYAYKQEKRQPQGIDQSRDHSDDVERQEIELSLQETGGISTEHQKWSGKEKYQGQMPCFRRVRMKSARNHKQPHHDHKEALHDTHEQRRCPDLRNAVKLLSCVKNYGLVDSQRKQHNEH